MAKIYTDILLIGNELSGIVASTILAKKGLSVIHLSHPHQAVKPKNYFHHLWLGYDDWLLRWLLDFLELNLEFSKTFDKNMAFSMIEDQKVCLRVSPQDLTTELHRKFGIEGKHMANMLDEVSPTLYDRLLKDTATKEINSANVNRLILTAKEKMAPLRIGKRNIETIKETISMDPWHLLMTDRFLSPLEPFYSKYLAALVLKYGVVFPKKPLQSTLLTFKGMLLDSFYRYNGQTRNIETIDKTTIKKNRLMQIQCKSLCSYSPRFVIDARPFGHGEFSSFGCTEQINSGGTKATSHHLDTVIKSRGLSAALPRLGFIYTQDGSDNFFTCYQIFKPSKVLSNSLSLTNQSQEDTGAIRLVFKTISQSLNAGRQGLQKITEQVLNKYFCPGQIITHEEYFETTNLKIKQNPWTQLKHTVHTELANVFRAQDNRASYLLSRGPLANGLMLARILAKKTGLKLH